MSKGSRKHGSGPRRGRLWYRFFVLGMAIVIGGGGAAWWLARDRAEPIPPVRLPADAAVDPELRDAVRLLVAQIAQSPRRADLRSRLGLVYQANGLPRLAAESYRQAIDLGAEPGRHWYLIALAQERSGDLESAVESLERSIASVDTPAQAHWRAAQWLFDLGRLDEAERFARQAIERDAQSAAAWYALAQIHLARREPDSALRILAERGLLSGPNGPQAHQLLATAYRQLGDQEKAEQAARRAVSERPHWPEPIDEELGQHLYGAQRRQVTVAHLMRHERYEEAVPHLLSLKRDNPTDHQINNLLAVSYAKAGRHSEAVELLQQTVSAHPEHYTTRFNFARVLLDAFGDDPRRLAGALQHADHALALRPRSSEAHNLRGAILSALGRDDEAIESLTTAFELDSREPRVLLRVCTIERQLERWPDAEATSRRILRDWPQEPSAHLMLAHALIEQFRFEEAAAVLTNAARLIGPDDARIAQLRERERQLLTQRTGGRRP